jgi:hypothetical protein
MNITDHIFVSLETIFWVNILKFFVIYVRLETIFWVKILKFFDADPGWKNLEPGSGIRDGKKYGSGMFIQDP